MQAINIDCKMDSGNLSSKASPHDNTRNLYAYNKLTNFYLSDGLNVLFF